MTIYIGIDQSYRNSGIVMIDYNDSVIKFDVVQTLKEDGDYFSRSKIASESIVRCVQTVDEYSEGNVEGIAIEGLSFGTKGIMLQNLAGLQWMIINGLRDAGYDPKIYTPSTVKKLATGSGKADKQAMTDALPEKVRKMFETVTKTNGREDLADAYWLAQKVKQEMEKGI